MYDVDDRIVKFGRNRHLPGASCNDSTSQIIVSEETQSDDIEVKTMTLSSLINKYDLQDISLIKVDIEGGVEHILNDLFDLHDKINIPMYISFHYDWWQNKDLTRFDRLTTTQIEQIIKQPFCSIIFDSMAK